MLLIGQIHLGINGKRTMAVCERKEEIKRILAEAGSMIFTFVFTF